MWWDLEVHSLSISESVTGSHLHFRLSLVWNCVNVSVYWVGSWNMSFCLNLPESSVRIADQFTSKVPFGQCSSKNNLNAFVSYMLRMWIYWISVNQIICSNLLSLAIYIHISEYLNLVWYVCIHIYNNELNFLFLSLHMLTTLTSK